METKLHSDVIGIAKENPALVFSLGSLKAFFLKNFLDAKDQLSNRSVSIEGSTKVQVRLIDLSIDDQFEIELTQDGPNIFIGIKTEFKFEIALHETANQQNEFSQIKLTIRKFKSLISVVAPNLLIDKPNFDVVPADPNLSPIYFSPTRLQAMAHAGITEENITAIEGAFAFVMPGRIISALFTTINKIDLTELFTAFELKGAWNLFKVDDGLLVIPSGGITIRENLGCPLTDSIPLLSVTTNHQDPVAEQSVYSWPIRIGAPVANSFTANNILDGFASIYLPKAVLGERFSTVIPSVTYSEDSNSFIGYNFSLTASFNYVGIDIDPARNGFVVNLDFLVQGSAAIYIDVPCFGECDIAHVDLKIGASKLSIFAGFLLSNDKDGKLQMSSLIDNNGISIGDLDVSIFCLAGVGLAFAGGGGAVTGFIFDKIAGRIIESIIPSKIKEVIKKMVNSNNVQLIDLGTLAKFANIGKEHAFNEVTYSGYNEIDNQSILTGLVYNG